MKTPTILLAIAFYFVLHTDIFAQQISFEEKRQTIAVSNIRDFIYYVYININPSINSDTIAEIRFSKTQQYIDSRTKKITIHPGVTKIEVPYLVHRFISFSKDSVEIFLDINGKAVSNSMLVFSQEELANNESKKVSDYRYRLMLGHSFNMIDDGSSNPLISYGRFDFFNPQMLKSGNRDVGLHLYVYQTNFSTSSDQNPFGADDQLNDMIKLPGQGGTWRDSLKYAKNTYKRTRTLSTEVFGFGFFPQHQLGIESPSTKLYFSAGFDYARRTYSANYSYDLIKSDTVRAVVNPITVNPSSIKKYKVIYHEIYAGVGLLWDHTNDICNFRGRYIVGALLFVNSTPVTENSPISFTHWFNLEVMEKLTKLDLSLGIDFRQSTHTGFIYNVYLSKTFSIKKLADLVSGK